MALARSSTAVACAAALLAASLGSLQARQASAPPQRGTSAGLDGLLASSLVFVAADADKDGAVTAAELKAAMEKWFADADAGKSGAVTREQLTPALDAAMPMSGLAALFGGGRGAKQPDTPRTSRRTREIRAELRK